MRRTGIVCLFLCLFCQMTAVTAGIYNKTNDGVSLKISDNYLSIRFCTESIVHFTVSTGKSFQLKSLVVDRKWKPVKFTVSDFGKFLILKTKTVKMTVNCGDGSTDINDQFGKPVLHVAGIEQNSLKKKPNMGDGLYEIHQSFVITPDEGLFGLGQFQDGVMNYRGKDIYLVQANRTAINPFLVSTNHYGIYWDNYSETSFSELDNQMQFWSAAARCVDYYVMVGSDIDAVIEGYRETTGKAPLNAKWTYGYWQSKERYTSGAELIGIANEFRERKIPIDGLVQDWNYWPDAKHFSGMTWDTVHYPTPERTIDSLHKVYRVHLMNSIWPCLGVESAVYKELLANSCIYPNRHWSEGKLYDCYNPTARDIYWKHVNSGLFSKGVDAFWMDGSEPELTSSADPYITASEIIKLGKNYFGSYKEFLNPYSLYHTKGVYEHQRMTSENKRVFIMTRSVFAGQQRYGATTWSGDIGSNWKVLRNQISAGLNFCMSGVPYWNSDIGGFLLDSQGGMYPEGGADPAYRELYVRWFQFGAFCPIFRSHGTEYPREPWRFGDVGSENYETILQYDRLRYRLLPYIYSVAWQITKNGSTLMRGLPMDFPGDKAGYTIDNEYMFGPALLVCPVTNPVKYLTKKKVDFIPAKNLMSRDGKQGCLDIDYFAGKDSSNPVFECKIVELAVTWSGQLPQQLVDKPYSVQMNGSLAIDDSSGAYTFSATTSGGAQVWIDGRQIINAPDNASLTNFSANYVFTRTGKHQIKILHFQPKPGECSFKFEWANSNAVEKLSSTLTSYLPENKNGWFDFWTNEKLLGGQLHTREVPLSIMPIYVKAGSILPFGPVVQSTGDNAGDTLDVRIYPGNDARFTLYEDEGDSYRYEKGLRSEIAFRWIDSKKEIVIGKRDGEFPGMKKDRYFRILMVEDGNTLAAGPSMRVCKIVRYSGKPVSVDCSAK